MPGEQAPKVSAIIPTWKRSDLLRKCLESLWQQSFTDFEIIIVSNGAGDWAVALAEEFGCRLVSFAENRGFAAAINAGIAASRAPFVALLNDDVELDPGWLEKLKALLENRHDISFCCGKMYRTDRRVIDNTGDALSMGGGSWRLGHGRSDAAEFDFPKSLFAVSFTATLFRRAVFEKLGGLDEEFISYLEDMDFSLRLRRAGLRGLYWPQAVACHYGGASSGGPESRATFRLLTRNQLLLLGKHYPLPLWLLLGPRIVGAQLLWAAMAVRKGLFAAYLGGVAGFLRAWPKMRRQHAGGRGGEWRELRNWLRESEAAIAADIAARQKPAQDTYWRWYFALFPVRRPPAAAPGGVADGRPQPAKPEAKKKVDPSSVHSSG